MTPTDPVEAGAPPNFQRTADQNGERTGRISADKHMLDRQLIHTLVQRALEEDLPDITAESIFDQRDRGAAAFVIKADGKELFRSEPIKDHKLRDVTVSVAGVKQLELLVENAGDGNNRDWGVWIEPQVTR